jgi:long-chain acyl-CoA synthetase
VALLPKEFSLESGELTPTLKVKRKVIEERYQKLIDGLYEGT